jgi:hypothetical protein
MHSRNSPRPIGRLRSSGGPSGRAMPMDPRVPRSRRRLIAAAFHEAGHAVAAYHVKVRFRRIAIGKNTAKELGWLELWLTPEASVDGVADVRTEHAIERSVIALLAGSQAERMALGRAKYLGSGLDFFEAVRYAGYLCRTRSEMSAYLRWMQLRVRALVESPSWRRPIEALATCLVQRRELGAGEARRIIRRALPMALEMAASEQSSELRQDGPPRMSGT